MHQPQSPCSQNSDVGAGFRSLQLHRRGTLVRAGLLLVIASLAFSGEAHSQDAGLETAGMSSERLARVNRLVEDYISRGELAGTVTLIARRGHIVHFEAHGNRYVEENLPMQRDTIFRIASMTKPIASVALMMLYEEGLFDLDDPISKWLPEYADLQVAIPAAPADARVAEPFKLVPATRPITVRHVLTHTAGLPNTYRGLTRDMYLKAAGDETNRAGTVEESLLRTAKVPLNFQPGDTWEYGRATDIVGVLVEKMSGQTLDAFLSERIFQPLGMVDTHFNVPQEKVERLAALYKPNAEGKIELMAPPVYREPGTYFSGAGGLASTAMDYYRFHQMMLAGGELDGVRILGRKTVELMITNHIGELPVWLKGPGYGFGLGYSVLLDPAQANEPLSPGTYGWGGAFCTYFFVDPTEDLIGIFMTQVRPYTHLDVRRQFAVLAAQAIVDQPRNTQGPVIGHQAIR